MTDPQPGDRIRATYVGTVEPSKGSPNLRVKLDNGKLVYLWRDRLGDIETLNQGAAK